MKLNHIVYRLKLDTGENMYTDCLFKHLNLERDPERHTGFIHRRSNKDVFENDVLIEIEETDEGDVYHMAVVTWISEWAMFTILGHGERVAYEDEGISALDDRSAYIIDQKEIDLYKIYKGNKHGLNWNEYLKELE